MNTLLDLKRFLGRTLKGKGVSYVHHQWYYAICHISSGEGNDRAPNGGNDGNDLMSHKMSSIPMVTEQIQLANEGNNHNHVL